MKLLTLNTHSLMESDYEKKLSAFVEFVLESTPDVIALQEIMQPCDNKIVLDCDSYIGKIPVKEGNHALNIVVALRKRGKHYNLVWLGFKKSYGRFDEGLAILTPYKIDNTSELTLSPFDDYENWKTRKALGILLGDVWFFSVHMGWWDDFDSPFQYELTRLIQGIPPCKRFWLMGDFNSVANESDGGYDLIKSQGLIDTYDLAQNKDDGMTATRSIDGWGDLSGEKIRIDYIFTNKIIPIEASSVVFNGCEQMKISDHNGVFIKLKGEK